MSNVEVYRRPDQLFKINFVRKFFLSQNIFYQNSKALNVRTGGK